MIIYFVGKYNEIIIMNNLKIFFEIIQYTKLIVRKEFMFMFNDFYNGIIRCVFKYGGI